jgi:hypothetical protein
MLKREQVSIDGASITSLLRSPSQTSCPAALMVRERQRQVLIGLSPPFGGKYMLQGRLSEGSHPRWKGETGRYVGRRRGERPPEGGPPRHV